MSVLLFQSTDKFELLLAFPEINVFYISLMTLELQFRNNSPTHK